MNTVRCHSIQCIGYLAVGSPDSCLLRTPKFSLTGNNDTHADRQSLTRQFILGSTGAPVPPPVPLGIARHPGWVMRYLFTDKLESDIWPHEFIGLALQRVEWFTRRSVLCIGVLRHGKRSDMSEAFNGIVSLGC